MSKKISIKAGVEKEESDFDEHECEGDCAHEIHMIHDEKEAKKHQLSPCCHCAPVLQEVDVDGVAVYLHNLCQ